MIPDVSSRIMTEPPARGNYPSVLQMAAPLMVSFVMRSAFTFVDTIYAAIEGDAAVSAIGLTVPFEFIMIAIWIGLSTGLTSVLSRAMGANETRKIEQYLQVTWRLVWIVSPLFLVLGVVIWFGAPRLGLEEDEASRRVAERSKDAPPESDSRQDQCSCAAPLSDAFVSAGIFGDPMILLFMIS